MVTFRLLKKGTSRDLRTKVLKRHIIYFVLYLFMLGYIFFELYSDIGYSHSNDNDSILANIGYSNSKNNDSNRG